MITETQDLSTASQRGSPEFTYWAHGGWAPLPTWAGFFRCLGAAVANFDVPSQRLVAAVTVPTRSFAACFAALGVVQARLRSSSETDAADHFERLTALPPGAALTVMDAGRKYKAVFLSAAEQEGRRGIWIQHEQDQLKRFITEHISHRVQIGSTGKDRLPKRPDMQPARNGDSFAAVALGLLDPRVFTNRDDFAALLIGQLSALRAEMTEQPIACVSADSASHKEGTLKSLLRPRAFMNDDECYRTEVVSDLRADSSAEVDLIPPVVVFDGARGYLRHRNRWRKSSWIVVLDLAGRLLDDGVAAVNDDYIQRRVTTNDSVLRGLSPPPAVELTVFVEARR